MRRSFRRSNEKAVQPNIICETLANGMLIRHARINVGQEVSSVIAIKLYAHRNVIEKFRAASMRLLVAW